MNIIIKIMKLTLISLLAVTIIAKPTVTYYSSSVSSIGNIVTPFSDSPSEEKKIK